MFDFFTFSANPFDISPPILLPGSALFLENYIQLSQLDFGHF